MTTIIKVDDNRLITAITSATRRLFVIAPGLTSQVAEAVKERWSVLGRDAVNVILDVDPEVCRLGYGDIRAVELLEKYASEMETTINHQPGIRIGIIIADDTSLIYSPTPLLIEAGSTHAERPNGIMLDAIPKKLEEEVGLGENGAESRAIGLDKAPSEKIQKVKAELQHNPPLEFDLARKVRVFNSQFEFVEFELLGCHISRKTVPIPNELMGFAKSERVQRLLKSSFHLIDEQDKKLFGQNHELSEAVLFKRKDEIVKKFLISLKGYGKVVLRTNKQNLIDEVNDFQKKVKAYRNQVEAHLQQAMDANRKALVAALLPSVKKTPPTRWIKFLGEEPHSNAAIQQLLDSEIDRAFGQATDVIGEMRAELVFKGITYESLNDLKFIETAKKVIPFLTALHEEYDAARGK